MTQRVAICKPKQSENYVMMLAHKWFKEIFQILIFP